MKATKTVLIVLALLSFVLLSAFGAGRTIKGDLTVEGDATINSNLIVQEDAIVDGYIEAETFIPRGNTPTGVGSAIGGGQGNEEAGSYNVIAGGRDNQTESDYGAIGGGQDNEVRARSSTVGGGRLNTASKNYSTVSGGRSNTASGIHATVPGGRENEAAGNISFAAGRRAKALHKGSFVWADSQDEDFESTQNNEFAIRAANGVRIEGAGLTVNGGVTANYLSAGTISGDGAAITGVDAETLDGMDSSAFSVTGHNHDGLYILSTGDTMTGSLDMGGNSLLNLVAPTNASDAATKGYVDDQNAAQTESDPLFSASTASGISSNDVENWNEAHSWGDHAAAGYATGTPVYVESDPNAVLADGSRAMSGALDMGDNLISNVSDPVDDQDAATKAYVDAAASDIIVPDGLVLYYNFDEDEGGIVSDQSGEDHDAAVGSNALWTTDGVAGGAYVFSGGSNDYISSTDAGLPAGDAPRSISYWFTLDQLIPDHATHILTYGTPSYNQQVRMGIDWRLDRDQVSFSQYGGVVLSQEKVIQADSWYHVVYTYGGSGSHAMYLNGQLSTGHNELSGPLATALSGSFKFGSHDISGPPQMFAGRLDELRIYDRELTAEDIEILYALEDGDNLGNHIAEQSLDMADNQVKNVGEPTDAQDAATKVYVDDTVAAQVESDPVFNASIASGIASNDVANWDEAHGWGDHAAAGYVTNVPEFVESDPNAVLADGSRAMSGALEMGDNRVSDVADPIGAQDAATKAYVDAATSDVIVPDGLVLYYNFDEDEGGLVSDQSGNGFNGTVNGAAWSAAGEVGGAYNFAGDGQHIDMGPFSDWSSRLDEGFSLVMWVQLDSPSGGHQYLMGTSPGSAIQMFRFSTHYHNPGDISWYLRDDENDPRDRRWDSTGIDDGAWHHLALLVDPLPNSVEFYLDGQSVAADYSGGWDVPDNFSGFERSLLLGAIQYWETGSVESETSLRGSIDEVRIYDRILTADEVDELFNYDGTGGDNLGNHIAEQDLDMADNQVKNVADPTDAQDAATKVYVDDTVAAQVESDPVFSASIASGIASNDVVNWDEAHNWGDHAAAGYVTNVPEFVESDPNAVLADGSRAMSGALDMGDNPVSNVADPVDDQDAVTKGYLNDLIEGTGVPEDGLVLYYDFSTDEGGVVTDQSGNGNDGTVVNATHVSNSLHGGSYNFDGSGDRIQVADSPSLRVQQMTLSVWIQPAIDMGSPAPQHAILSKEGQGTAAGYYLGHHDYATGPVLNFKIMGGGYHNTLISQSLSAGTWYHIVGTYDGAVRNFYLDGTLMSSVTQSVTLAHNSEPIQIGAQAPGSHGYWNGEIDEVRIYNRALTVEEVQALNAGATPGIGDNLGNHTAEQDLDMANNQVKNVADPTDVQDAATMAYVDAQDAATMAYVDSALSDIVVPEDLLLYYSLDVDEGGVATDESGNGNDAVVTGTTYVAGGQFGGARLLNGDGDRFNPGTLGSFGSDLDNGFAIAFWINTGGAAPHTHYLFGAANPGANTMLYMSSHKTTPGDLYFYLRQDGGGVIDRKWYFDTGIEDGSWHHIALSVDPATSTVELYLDGSVLAPSAGGGGSLSNFSDLQNDLYIGHLNNLPYTLDHESFDGMMDDIRIYSRTITPDEVGQLVEGGDSGDNLGNHTAEQDLDMADNQIKNVADPTDAQDAATKVYVDDQIAAQSEIDPVFSSSVASGIDVGTVSNWNEAHSWGDHAAAGYVTVESNQNAVLVDGSRAMTGNLQVNSNVAAGSVTVGTDKSPGGASLTVAAAGFGSVGAYNAICLAGQNEPGSLITGGVSANSAVAPFQGMGMYDWGASDWRMKSLSFGGGQDWFWGYPDPNVIVFYTSPNYVGQPDDGELRMIIRESGNVGIGTADPSEELHVAGDILADGSMQASSFSGDGSGLTQVDAATLQGHSWADVTNAIQEALNHIEPKGDLLMGEFTNGPSQ